MHIVQGGACGVIAIVIENGHGKPSSNPEWGELNFHIALSYESNYSPLAMGK